MKVTLSAIAYLLLILSFQGNNASNAAEMFVTSIDGIYRAESNSSDSFNGVEFKALPLANLSYPFSLTFDYRDRTIYWTDDIDELIYRASVDGSNQEIIASGNILYPSGIAIDLSNDRLIWTDWGFRQIQSVNFDGTNRTVLINSTYLIQPEGITYSPRYGLIFWVDGPYVKRANGDGTHILSLASSNQRLRGGIVMDEIERRVYWSDYYNRRMYSMLLDGSDQQTVIAQTQGLPTRLAIYDEDIYYTSDLVIDDVTLFDRSAGDHVSIPLGSFRSPKQIFINEYTGDVTPAPYNITDFFECYSFPCQNGGTCVDLLDGYSCTCADGYEGSNCEMDIDDCSPQPCKNGATCNDRLQGYTCTCTAGFMGDMCEEDIDECSSNPCMNRGLCMDQVNGYSCACQSGYEGMHCQIDINECTSSPCLNGGTCQDLAGGFECICPTEFPIGNCLPNELSTQESGQLSSGAIAGIVIAVLVVVVLLVAILIMLCFKNLPWGRKSPQNAGVELQS